MAFDLEEWNIPRDNLLRSCFLIAAFELLRSLYFSFSSVSVMISHTNSYSILAYLSTIAWILTVVGLFVGLWKGRPTLLVFWLLFSGFATAMDIIYLIWNVTSSPVFDVDHFKHWSILYFGIFYECTGLYLVFRYFRRLYSYCLLEGGNYDWFSKDETQKTVEKMMQLKQYLQLQMQRLLKRQMRDNIKKHLNEQKKLVILNMFKEIKFLFRAIF